MIPTVSEKSDTLFRAEAFERYRQNRERAVLPRFARPRVLRGLWAVAALLVAGAALFWCERVPMYLSGIATTSHDAAAQGAVWLVIVPASGRGQLGRGQRVLVAAHGSKVEASAMVTTVIARGMARREVAGRWALSAEAIAALPDRVDVGVLRGVPSVGPQATRVDAYGARVEVGQTRLGALILSRSTGGPR